MRFGLIFIAYLYLFGNSHARAENCLLAYEALMAKLDSFATTEKNLKGAVYLSASSIEKNLSSTSWTERYFLNRFNGILTPYGTLGPNGPLQKLGPVGTNLWNSSRYITGVDAIDWTKISSSLTDNFGPLSAYGPAGFFNPFEGIGYNSFFSPLSSGKYLREGKSAAIVGPKGPHGVLGANGPFGPAGAHGYKIDPITGSYLKDGKPIQEISVENGKKYQLVEHYSPAQAETLSKRGKLDSSFVLDGELGVGAEQSLKVNAQKDNWVSFLAIPEKSGENFSVELVDTSGNVYASSNSENYVNFVQIRVPVKTPLTVRIRSLNPSSKPSGKYRLHVVSAPAEPIDQLEPQPYLSGLK